MPKQTEAEAKLTKKFEQLEKISRYFESEEVDIDEGIKKYEEGMKLAQDIKKQLESYELKINEIKEKYQLD